MTKFKVYMKDPDTLSDAIEEAVETEVEQLGLPDDEGDAVSEARIKRYGEICDTWFEYGEYLTVEIDTDLKTATVLSRHR